MALASVLMTGFVAPYLAGRIALNTVELETRRNREDELRLVMEHAAVKLTETIALLDHIRSNLGTLRSDDLEPLQESLNQLWLNEDRMAVRLGRNASEVKHYRESLSHVGTAHTLLHSGLGNGFAEPDFRELLGERMAAFEDQGAFFDAASARVGPGDSRGASRRRLFFLKPGH